MLDVFLGLFPPLAELRKWPAGEKLKVPVLLHRAMCCFCPAECLQNASEHTHRCLQVQVGKTMLQKTSGAGKLCKSKALSK